MSAADIAAKAKRLVRRSSLRQINPTRLSKYSVRPEASRNPFSVSSCAAEKLPSLPSCEAHKGTTFYASEAVLNTCSASTAKSVKTCPAPPTKIFRLTCRANQHYQLAPSFPGTRGVSRSSRNAGEDAVDAAAAARKLFTGRSFVSEQRRAGRTTPKRTAKPCGPDTRCWCQAAGGVFDPTGSISYQARSDGDKTNSSPGRSRHKP